MLDVYDVKTLGIYINTKDVSVPNYPCILHIHGDFVVGLDCDNETITYLLQGKKTTVRHDAFKKMWTGNALVVEESTEASEPDYLEHLRDGVISLAKRYSIPIMLVLAVLVGIADNFRNLGLYDFTRIALGIAGILVCVMLMEKQLFGKSHYGDRVCSLFHQADCNSVLDGKMAKILGISWSEIGLGYFTANTLLLSLFPESSNFVAVVNWAAMSYGVWSIYYQWHVAKSWCVLCVIVQAIIWTMGILAVITFTTGSITFALTGSILSCMFFAICIMAVHQYASANVTIKERVHAVQQFRALKANGIVAKTLIENGEFYETTLDDSSIIFGNPDAKVLVTILSNPHCNPCARMHERVEKLLRMAGNEICIQFIFSSFNEQLEDSSRYLISCYMNSSQDDALSKFALWYTQEKFDYKEIIRQNDAHIHTEAIEEEMTKHKKWRENTSLVVTPTILVNGHKLPNEYELEDLAMIVDITITKKNILQDINGRSTTPLGAEQLTAEETV